MLGELKSVCQEYYNRICEVESSKYDLEKEVEYKDYKVSEYGYSNLAMNIFKMFFLVRYKSHIYFSCRLTN